MQMSSQTPKASDERERRSAPPGRVGVSSTGSTSASVVAEAAHRRSCRRSRPRPLVGDRREVARRRPVEARRDAGLAGDAPVGVPAGREADLDRRDPAAVGSPPAVDQRHRRRAPAGRDRRVGERRAAARRGAAKARRRAGTAHGADIATKPRRTGVTTRRAGRAGGSRRHRPRRLACIPAEAAHICRPMSKRDASVPRRPAADRHAGHGRPALRALGDLRLRAFRRGRDGADRQQARAGAELRRPARAAEDPGARSTSSEHRACISAGRSSTAAASCCTPPTIRSSESSLHVSPDFAMTATVDILQDMARGDGPDAGAAGARLCRLGTGAARGARSRRTAG